MNVIRNIINFFFPWIYDSDTEYKVYRIILAPRHQMKARKEIVVINGEIAEESIQVFDPVDNGWIDEVSYLELNQGKEDKKKRLE